MKNWKFKRTKEHMLRTQVLKSHSFQGTLNLPKTKFPARSNLNKTLQDLIPKAAQDLYKQQLTQRKDSPLFILHDGPPYANGDLHLGHAMNKILKDFINRYQLVQGKRVYYKPGWDCHGLPIELKALETAKARNPLDIRKIASKHAKKTVTKQMEQFKTFGILCDFNDNYQTLDPKYEINQLNIFLKMLQNGLIKRQRKPVFWGTETKTALAEGELEYNDAHKSTACYVKFPSEINGKNISLLIWTSTPWTIPANKAIAINTKYEYVIMSNGQESLLCVRELASKLEGYHETGVISGADLVGITYTHPLTGEVCPLVHGDHVTNIAGTGLVHCAPGHGQEDYLVGLANQLDIYSPVDDEGRYNHLLPPQLKELEGLKVLGEGTPRILEIMTANGMLHKTESYTHSYPYDWRSKKPIIIRATPQWFADVSAIKAKAKNALDHVSFYPANGFNRLSSFINNRNEWCISRQRYWGVPIPALYNKNDMNECLMDEENVKHIINVIQEKGIESWFVEEDNVEKWLCEKYRGQGENWVKGKDTIDVWFDSGSSWKLIEQYLKDQPRGYLADVYLEGSDQHRGWFQSSLLTKIASTTDGQAPFKTIVTHGFTLDENGNKMSKSLGNVIAPMAIIKGESGLPALGVDGLRLWVAQANYMSDVAIGPTVLKHVGDSLKKFRLTMRFILGNLNDLTSLTPHNELRDMDKYALSKLHDLSEKCKKEYDAYNYSKVIQAISYHMNNELSAFYFDIMKDTLYSSAINDKDRRCVQTTLWHIYDTYRSILAPIMPIIIQETWNYLPKELTADQESPLSRKWADTAMFKDAELETRVENSYFKVAELVKTSGFDNISQLKLTLSCNMGMDTSIKDLIPSTITCGPVSDGTTIEFNGDEVKVSIEKTNNHKCPRCWRHHSVEEDHLCQRCANAM